MADYLVDVFGSHVVRTLMSLLANAPALPDGTQGRSKKSVTYRESIMPAKASASAAASRVVLDVVPPVFTRHLESVCTSIQRVV
jgi:hypothetical protein